MLIRTATIDDAAMNSGIDSAIHLVSGNAYCISMFVNPRGIAVAVRVAADVGVYSSS